MLKSKPTLRVDRDGVRVYETSRAKTSRSLAAIAASLILVCAFGVWFLLGSNETRVTQEPREPVVRTEPVHRVDEQTRPPVATPRSRRALRAVRVERGSAGASGVGVAGQEDAVGSGAQADIDASDLISALVAAGEKSGIAAFPLPGTNPPKSGIIVPEDFELPEGYVRHYQATDDGQRLEPILMFSPDYQFVDASGKPITLPEDLIVPPDLAPPGLPIRMLEIPERKVR